jgi:hypothetical protein|eukprot:COSAG01_NODE_3267_length_6330_cov_133.385331_9_plen_179_part_00
MVCASIASLYLVCSPHSPVARCTTTFRHRIPALPGVLPVVLWRRPLIACMSTRCAAHRQQERLRAQAGGDLRRGRAVREGEQFRGWNFACLLSGLVAAAAAADCCYCRPFPVWRLTRLARVIHSRQMLPRLRERISVGEWPDFPGDIGEDSAECRRGLHQHSQEDLRQNPAGRVRCCK